MGAPDQIPSSAVIGGGNQGPNPYFATGPPLPNGSSGIGQPYIIGDPTMPGAPQMPRGGGGVQGNLIGPNSSIF